MKLICILVVFARGCLVQVESNECRMQISNDHMLDRKKHGCQLASSCNHTFSPLKGNGIIVSVVYFLVKK